MQLRLSDPRCGLRGRAGQGHGDRPGAGRAPVGRGEAHRERGVGAEAPAGGAVPEPGGAGGVEVGAVHERGDGEGPGGDRRAAQRVHAPLDQARVQAPLPQLGQGEQGAEEGGVGDHAEHVRARERPVQRGEGLLASGGVGDDLGEHRVVGRGDLEPLGEGVVHARPGGQGEVEHGPAGGQESRIRILGVDPGLDRMAADLHVLLREVERLPRSDAQLRGDEVDAGHRLGDGVLDLQARVHLEEERLVGRGRRG